MILVRHGVTALALTAAFFGGGQRLVGDEKKPVAVTFGALEAASPEAVREQAQAWLKQVGKADAAALQQLDAIWKQAERPVLDRLADVFAYGDAEAQKLLARARDVNAPAPTAIPAVLKDDARPAFFKANLALAWSRQLSHRRVHEEALESLKLFKAEQTVDPATYLFHRAICEHSLLRKDDAKKSILRLLDEAADSPERYKTVSTLMLLDMQTWKAKDLAAISRLMDNSERRLELARGGDQTQKIQKEIVARLDEMIKDLENKAKKKPG